MLLRKMYIQYLYYYTIVFLSYILLPDKERRGGLYCLLF